MPKNLPCWTTSRSGRLLQTTATGLLSGIPAWHPGRKKSADAIVGSLLFDEYTHFSQQMYRSRIDPILQGGPPTIFSSQLHGRLFPCVTPHGKKRIFETTVSNIPSDEEGEFYALFVIRDVTELSNRIMEYRKIQKQNTEEIEHRKIVEDELRKANEKILAQDQGCY